MTASARIIDVWAPWCAPCRNMEPIVDQAALEYGSRVAVEKINADEHPGRIRELKVLAVPTLIAVRDDREVARLTGAQSGQAIHELFALATGDQHDGPKRVSATDRIIRLAAGLALLTVGWLSGPAVPLLIIGAAIGATTLPRPNRTRSPERTADRHSPYRQS